MRHDLPHLAAVRPRLAALAPVDTLWLNPLAFPRNPYHHLVKHYHDGRLQAGHVNDPELDAQLVFEVLNNQLEAFRGLNAETPDALTAYARVLAGEAMLGEVLGVERRRRWSDDEKLEILPEEGVGGASVTQVGLSVQRVFRIHGACARRCP